MGLDLVDTQAAETIGEPQPLLIDPFSFLVGVTSRIQGLGGDTPGHQPEYAFHTPYVEAEPGMCTFTLHFAGLRAKRGTLLVNIYMLPLEPGATARVATAERIQLNRIVQQGGKAVIKFEAFRGVSFAAHGLIAGSTDAEAQDLVVELDRPADPNAKSAVAIEARSSAFGQNAVKPASHLLSLAQPSLGAPVCQMLTAAQLEDRAFAEWVDRLDPGTPPDRMWVQAYVLQALSCYGVLQSDAAGLGFGARDCAVPAIIAANAIDVTLADGDNGAGLPLPERPTICDPQLFDAHVRAVSANPGALPPELVNFDFVWSQGTAGTLGSVAEGAAFVEKAMACLRPGGFGVHVLPFAVGTADDGAFQYFRREDVERLMLTLISRNYQVAQAKILPNAVIDRLVASTGEPHSWFGVIARRQPSAY